MSASDWDKVMPASMAHHSDATVIRRLTAAEREVTVASAKAFASHGNGASPKRRASLRAKLQTACEVRDMWQRVADTRKLRVPHAYCECGASTSDCGRAWQGAGHE